MAIASRSNINLLDGALITKNLSEIKPSRTDGVNEVDLAAREAYDSFSGAKNRT